LLGVVSGGGVDTNVFPIYLYKYFAPYIQHDWKVSRRLTLNLGLRWDLNVSPNERFDRMNRSFDPDVLNPVDRLVNKALLPGPKTLRGGLLFANVGDIPRTASNLDRNNIQPRAGAAYQITEKLVARGGWGLYFLNPNNDYLQTTGYSTSTPLITSNNGGRNPIAGSASNPFPSGLLRPAGASLGLETFLGRGFNFVNPEFDVPYTHQFSFGFQYEMPWRTKLDVSYVGNRTRKMQTSRPFNDTDLEYRNRCNLADGGNPFFCDERLPNPFRGLAPFTGTNHFTDETIGRGALYRPMPHFTGLTEVTRNDGGVWYNSLQAIYEIRGSAGLNFNLAYTLSKMISQDGYMDTKRDLLQRSLYDWDRPHRIVAASIYDLPIGRGKR
ncbi:MAG: TonB-dependent receptor domain-containing protein, partial [Bryobacteraceae bacterium]